MNLFLSSVACDLASDPEIRAGKPITTEMIGAAMHRRIVRDWNVLGPMLRDNNIIREMSDDVYRQIQGQKNQSSIFDSLRPSPDLIVEDDID